MKKYEFDIIKDKAKAFNYSSFTYIEYDDVANYDLMIDSSAIILLLGYNYESKCYQYIWAANKVDALISSLNHEKTFFLSFIPDEWVGILEKSGFHIRNAWHDYFLYNLDDIIIKNNYDTDYLKLSEVNEASSLTMECREQSRGFTGQTPQWFINWLASDNEIKNTAVLVERAADGTICGILCVGTYGHDTDKGPVVWIREVAVKPDFQNKGIARKLLSQALVYGKEKGAQKAFLAVDEDNKNAIHLYKSIGFTAGMEKSEITMIKHN